MTTSIAKGFILAGVLAAWPLHGVAQESGGGISPDMLEQIRQAQPHTQAERALFNALAANSIDALAVNHANKGPVDTYFNVETPAQSITDQQRSGRCWTG